MNVKELIFYTMFTDNKTRKNNCLRPLQVNYTTIYSWFEKVSVTTKT